MWLAFLPTFLYWYFLLLQVFFKKVGIFTNYLGIYVEPPSIYYYNYSPVRWVGTPPPCRQNHREDHANQTRQRNSWHSERVGGFWLFFFSFYLWKYRRKRKNMILYGCFCCWFDYIFFICFALFVFIVFYFLFIVFASVVVLLFFGLFFYFRFYIFLRFLFF